MAHIDFVDQTLRDGQQSLWGMRLRAGMVRAIADDLEHAGFRAVEVTGSSLFECTVRYSKEDPWEGLDLVRRWMPRSELRAAVCQNRIGTFGMTPDALMDLWVQTLVRHGIDAFWVYDCLFNMAEMRRLCRTIADAGARALGAIMFGISPVHTDEWFARRVREMASWPEVAGIYVEDAPGILTPDRVRTLVPALLEAAGDKPVEWHFHNTTGFGAVNYTEAVQLGGTTLHTCSRPLANGPSLPSIEQTLRNLRWLGHEHSIDESRLPAIAEHCERVARQEGHPVGVPNEFDVFAYHHHLPGGMTGTLKAQLAQYGMQDRLVEVLEEVVRVREELGHPVSATPFSQLIGIQSVLNVVSAERWSVVPDEVIIYLLGRFGTPPAPVDEDVRDKVLSSVRGRQFEGWERPQPSLAELREQYGGPHLSDEELILRYMVPLDDLETARAAGPVKQTYDFHDAATLPDLIEHALTLRRPRHVRIRVPEGSVTLRSGRPDEATSDGPGGDAGRGAGHAASADGDREQGLPEPPHGEAMAGMAEVRRVLDAFERSDWAEVRVEVAGADLKISAAAPGASPARAARRPAAAAANRRGAASEEGVAQEAADGHAPGFAGPRAAAPAHAGVRAAANGHGAAGPRAAASPD